MASWSRAAATAARAVAASPAGRRFIEATASALASAVGEAGAGRVTRSQASRAQWTLATKLARQVHGQLSEAVFIGSAQEHWVVWKDGVPIAAFPPVDGDLASKDELRHVTDDDRFDPPPAARPGRRTWTRPPADRPGGA